MQVVRHATESARVYGIVNLDLSPDGGKLLASSLDSRIRIYDVLSSEWQVTATLSGHRNHQSFYTKVSAPPQCLLFTQTGYVPSSQAAFGYKGRYVIGGSRDEWVYLWRVGLGVSRPLCVSECGSNCNRLTNQRRCWAFGDIVAAQPL